jgi:hypothetical protein
VSDILTIVILEQPPAVAAEVNVFFQNPRQGRHFSSQSRITSANRLGGGGLLPRDPPLPGSATAYDCLLAL